MVAPISKKQIYSYGMDQQATEKPSTSLRTGPSILLKAGKSGYKPYAEPFGSVGSVPGQVRI
jgi:hypothetical protein